MNHGDGESGRVHAKSNHSKRKSSGSGDDFAQAIARIAVAQVCESAGFQSFQQSALDTLSDVTVRYIQQIGKTAQYYANSAGRTDGNAFDIIRGLEDLGLAQGFAAASDVDHCLASSGAVGEIVQYVLEAEDIPFAYSIPPFPVAKERKPVPSFLQVGEEPPGEHIPPWLPAFPDPQSYLQLASGSEMPADSTMEKLPGKTGYSLNFQRQIACNGSGGPSSAIPRDAGEEKECNPFQQQLADSNPFLALPLQFGEKEVSHVVPPAKLSSEKAINSALEHNPITRNHISVLQTFAPAIEALKCGSEKGEKRVHLSQRPSVQFKIAVEKKTLGGALNLSPLGRDVEEMSPLFRDDNVKDEKKRRAEKILKQSMENPGELAQL